MPFSAVLCRNSLHIIKAKSQDYFTHFIKGTEKQDIIQARRTLLPDSAIRGQISSDYSVRDLPSALFAEISAGYKLAR